MRSLSSEDFTVLEIPAEEKSISDLVSERKAQFAFLAQREAALKKIAVKVNIDGPYGVTFFGDPHVDDPGSDICRLELDLTIVRETVGLFAANVGDVNNNWIGRLGRLFSKQGVTEKDAWRLVEWMLEATDWLFLVGGNHDCWSGDSSPLKWIARHADIGAFEPHGIRMGLTQGKREIVINSRHDFPGQSMWNNAHGPMRAAQMGWRDHVLTCGHKHTSGYGVVKDPASGLISHCIRVAAYKIIDDYAKQGGFLDGHISPSVTCIFQPQYADSDPRLVTVFHDTEEAAEYLTWKRNGRT
tara:strand:+ start:172 stop:1068 length:897 start_codon:yes stop_codon:yes gene_type:complete